MKHWYGFEGPHHRYLGKAYVSEAEIDETFRKTGMTYVILPSKLVSIYGMKKIPGARSK